jgi:hypothetical protein
MTIWGSWLPQKSRFGSDIKTIDGDQDSKTKMKILDGDEV